MSGNIPYIYTVRCGDASLRLGLATDDAQSGGLDWSQELIRAVTALNGSRGAWLEEQSD